MPARGVRVGEGHDGFVPNPARAYPGCCRTMTFRSIVLARLFSAVFVLVAAAAGAQVQWYEHYTHGLEHERAGECSEALREFAAAARIERQPRAHVRTYGAEFLTGYDPYFHNARCLLELGRAQEAGAQLTVAEAAGVTPKDQLVLLRARIEDALHKRVETQPTAVPIEARLAVSTAPAGATVTVDGRRLGSTPIDPAPVSAGSHTVRLEFPGYRSEERVVHVADGSTFALDVTLLPLPSPPAATPRLAQVIPTAEPVHPGDQRPTVTNQVAAAVTPGVIASGAIRTAVPRTPSSLPAAVVGIPSATMAPAVQPTASGLRPIDFSAQRPVARGVVVVATLLVVVMAVVLGWRTRRRLTAKAARPSRMQDAPTRLLQTATPMGRYDLLGVLGRGGMGTTYRARRRKDGAIVALKIPHETCLAEPTFVARFLREGKLGEQLHHPGIVTIHEAGEDHGRPFLAMELLAGRTLKQELASTGAFPLRRCLEVARGIAEALDYAHAKGVVHRDLKPDNVMLLPDDGLKVMDFGIARTTGSEGLTGTNLFLGTPLYAAPEMVDPKRIDHRVDLYALGIILFEMLEGTVPFTADSPYRVIEMHQSAPLPDRDGLAVGIPNAVWAVVTRLCAKDPDDRFPSAEALLVELGRLLHDFSDLEPFHA